MRWSSGRPCQYSAMASYGTEEVCSAHTVLRPGRFCQPLPQMSPALSWTQLARAREGEQGLHQLMRACHELELALSLAQARLCEGGEGPRCRAEDLVVQGQLAGRDHQAAVELQAGRAVQRSAALELVVAHGEQPEAPAAVLGPDALEEGLREALCSAGPRGCCWVSRFCALPGRTLRSTVSRRSLSCLLRPAQKA